MSVSGDSTLTGELPLRRYFRVDRRDIVFLKFVLEAYEGMNVMSSVDKAAGIIRVLIMPGFKREMTELLRELSGQLSMEEVQWDGEEPF